MITTVTTYLKNKVLFIILFPVSWVLHGYLSYYGLVSKKDAAQLALFYCGVALILTGIFWLFYRNIFKAALLCFFLLCLQFYFGPIHDFLKDNFPKTIFSKYSFLLSIIILAIITFAVYLARYKKAFSRVTLYLNILFFILLLTDCFSLLIKPSIKTKISNELPEKLDACDTCKRPDIFLIVADGYPGNRELKDLFNFDNSKFENALKNRGFFIIDSSVSNYNFTPFSIASMLNQEYLTGIEGRNSNKSDMSVCFQTIKQSKTLSLIEKLGYEIYNLSIFDLKNKPSITTPTFIQNKTRPILSQTLLYRIRRDLGYHLVTTLKIGSEIKKLRETDLRNNVEIITQTKKIAKQKTRKPKFVYSHIVMPHYPYYYDSAANKIDYTLLTDEFITNEDAFVSYLKYANKEFIALIDSIKKTTNNTSIILFLSDHGFREFRKPVDSKYHFMTLNSVFIPDKNYTKYYKGQSNINTFRVLFNTIFNQNYPLLKDSSSYLSE